VTRDEAQVLRGDEVILNEGWVVLSTL